MRQQPVEGAQTNSAANQRRGPEIKPHAGKLSFVAVPPMAAPRNEDNLEFVPGRALTGERL